MQRRIASDKLSFAVGGTALVAIEAVFRYDAGVELPLFLQVVFAPGFSKTLVGQRVEASSETLSSIQRCVVADASQTNAGEFVGPLAGVGSAQEAEGDRPRRPERVAGGNLEARCPV